MLQCNLVFALASIECARVHVPGNMVVNVLKAAAVPTDGG
jgi:hypothetical protein